MEFSGQYLTYQEYKVMGGTQPQMPFNLLEFRARKEINKYTSNRIKETNENIKLCVFDLINMFISINNGVEISGNAINYDNEEVQKQVRKIIIRDLVDDSVEDNTPLTYCGI